LATKAYEERDIELQDETEITIRPLPIGKLRRFMETWQKFAEVDDEDQTAAYDIFVNCSGIALEKDFTDKFAEAGGTAGKGKEVLSKPYKDYLEDVLDIETIYVIFEVCAGMKLNDPNLLAAAARIQEAGTN
jgi:hypothetical protein